MARIVLNDPCPAGGSTGPGIPLAAFAFRREGPAWN